MALQWHTEELPAIFKALETTENGLTTEEAARRLRENGSNVLPEARVDNLAVIFLRQFQSPLIYILLLASVAVLFIGEVADAVIILAVLLFNAIAGTIQEGRAQNTLLALKRYVETTAIVVRGGTEIIISDREVVEGDVLVLREGEKISADARIIAVNGLKVDEAALTGESEPVSKMPEAVSPATDEKRTMVFKGTHIVTGSGRAVVVATGIRSAIGAIAKEISAIDTEIPLKENIRVLSRAIIMVVAAISAFLFLLSFARGQDLVTIFTTVVSLAVSIIPEGLPIVITLVLATGVWRMSKRNALVKKLQAVEALGQARIIAVDKTGTITKNELVVREVWTDKNVFSIHGVGYEPSGAVDIGGSVIDAANHPEILQLGKMAALSASARVFFSEAEQRWHVAGDPTEAALRVFGEKVGFKKDDLLRESPLVSEIPFDYRLKYHAVVFAGAEGDTLVASGAPESILALSTRLRREGKDHPLDAAGKEKLEDVLAAMSDRGLRVVAIAARFPFSGSLAPDTIHGLTFLGYMGMQDVLRDGVADALSRAREAGIRVVMITGDHERTARAIAKDAGIWHEHDEILSGAVIDNMFDAELSVRVAHTSVFARVTPEHKLRIINAYRQRGEIIAMTGDGVNDAPSLVAADLGVAMGKIGTEVAKEAADIVLLDDDFGSIISAIEEGRSIYKTIKKVVLYLFSTSAGEVLVIVGALLLGYPLPLLASQIIWLNFITDGFLTIALAMEPKELGLLSRTFEKPRKYLLDESMVRRMVLMALPMMVGTLYLFQSYASTDIAKAWTISLTSLAVFQWFNAWNCRSDDKSILQTGLFTNLSLFAATLLVVVLQLFAVYSPFFQRFLHTVPLTGSEWIAIIGVAASIIVVEEIRKFFVRRRGTGRDAQKSVERQMRVA